MSYLAIFPITGQTGKISLLQTTPFINFSQIFEGVPQYYPGSTIQFQEILTIATAVDDENIVDVDNGWFIPKKRLGTYQLLDAIGFTLNEAGDESYLVHEIQKITRRTQYTVTANPSTLVAQHEQIALDNCNFYLEPDVYLFPGTVSPVAGFKPHSPASNWLGSVTLSRAPLEDSVYNQRISGVNLCLKPGVSGLYIRYEVAAINQVYTDYPSQPVPKCEFLPASCEVLFSAFLAEPANVAFSTKGECLTAISSGGVAGYDCVPLVWTCPNDSTQVFTYYGPTAN
jgi:hypothetical protein